MLNLPKQTFGSCDGKPLPKPKRETREQAKAAKRAEIDGIKRDANKSERAKVSAKFRRMIFDRDGWKCVRCNADPAKDNSVVLVLAHVRPVASGGQTTEENCQCWCKACNDGQGAAAVWRNSKDKQTQAFVQPVRERGKAKGGARSQGASHAEVRGPDSVGVHGRDRGAGGAVPQHGVRNAIGDRKGLDGGKRRSGESGG